MRRARTFVHLPLGLAAIVFMCPLAIMVITALKPLSEINSGSLFAWPDAPTLAPWWLAWNSAPIGQESRGIADAFLNSLYIVVPSLILSVGFGGAAGLALSLRRTRKHDLLFAALLICLFVPAQIAIYPMLLCLRSLGLYGSWTGVIATQVIWGVPFLALIFRNHFVSLPADVIRAAYVDGASFWQMLWYVLLPMSRPVLVTAVVLQFTYLWNEFLLNLTFAPVGHQPVMVALNILAGAQMGSANYNVNMAAAVFVALPTMLAYLFCGRFLVRGILAGSVRC